MINNNAVEQYSYGPSRYRPTDTAEWKTMKIPSKKITEATIPNLAPGQEYEFMVLSQDKHGDGMFSKTIRVLTQPKSGTYSSDSYLNDYCNL